MTRSRSSASAGSSPGRCSYCRRRMRRGCSAAGKGAGCSRCSWPGPHSLFYLLQDPHPERLLLRDAALHARRDPVPARPGRGGAGRALGARPRGHASSPASSPPPSSLLFLRDTLPLATYRDWRNSVRFVDDMARRFGPQDVVIFEQKGSVHLLSLPLWAVCGVNALELARVESGSRPPAAPDRRLGRTVSQHLLRPHLPHERLRPVPAARRGHRASGTYEWERAYTSKPQGREPRELHFQISRVVPLLGSPGAAAARDRHRRLRRRPGLRLLRQGRRRRTTPTAGRAPARPCTCPGARRRRGRADRRHRAPAGHAAPVPVAVSMGCTAVGRFEAGREWEEHRLRLPDPLPPGPPVLRLDVATFRPANVWPGDADTRDLGVMG